MSEVVTLRNRAEAMWHDAKSFRDDPPDGFVVTREFCIAVVKLEEAYLWLRHADEENR